MFDVIIGTTVHREGAYVLDKFLANQKQIQQNDPLSSLVLATCEHDFVKQLEDLLDSLELRGTVLFYEVIRPEYARNRVWNIACGREAIRRYTLSKTDASYLLFLDSDMTFDPLIIDKMKKEIDGFDVVFSGYPLKRYGVGLAGFGCVLLSRSTLEKVDIRCYEFKNGEVIFEDNVLEMDLFRLGIRVKKGFFLSVEHYIDAEKTRTMIPQSVSVFLKISNWSFFRYVLIRTSMMLQCNIPWKFKVFLDKLH
jgi:hypothetical protein